MIYTVYHKFLDGQEVWSVFERAEVERLFRPYAVSKHPKVLRNAPAPVVEAELPWHNPLLQERGFLETSCYVHVLRNGLHEGHEFVGVTQYDMRWTPEAAVILREQKPGEVLACFHGVLSTNGVLHPLAYAETCDWGFVLRSYNKRFGTAHTLRDLDGQPFTFFQTYVMERAVFAELAGWLETLCEELYPWANRFPWPSHWGHMGGCTERAEALFAALRAKEGAIKLKHLPLDHDYKMGERLGAAPEHYDMGPGQLAKARSGPGAVAP